MSDLEVRRAKNAANVKRWRENNPERAAAIRIKFLSSKKGRELAREHGRRTRQKSIQRIYTLKNKPCMDCGGNFHPCAMDFDHVRGKKEFEIGGAIGLHASLPRLMAEIEKCDLVCSNCHRI